MDWTEHLMLLYTLLSIPFLMWIAAFVILFLIARSGRIEVRVNLLALVGAFIGLCSFVVGWSVIERGYDWEIIGAVSVLLLFTYPFTVITPIAGIGNAIVLLYSLSYANEVGGVIEPMSGYLLGWASVVVLAASMIVPLGLKFDNHWRFPFGHRYLTLHFNRKKVENTSTSSWEKALGAEKGKGGWLRSIPPD